MERGGRDDLPPTMPSRAVMSAPEMVVAVDQVVPPSVEVRMRLSWSAAEFSREYWSLIRIRRTTFPIIMGNLHKFEDFHQVHFARTAPSFHLVLQDRLPVDLGMPK